MRATYLPFAQPDLDDTELEEIGAALASGWITSGPKTQQFEAAFAEAVGAQHAIAVNSCTAAMHLALEAIGLKPGDEVITSPYTFAASAEVVRYFDARPVFVDVDPISLNMDPDHLEAALTERTRVLLPVHVAGAPAEMDAICEVARRYGLAVVEDAAHAFPTQYKGRMVGAIGDFTCFSFYATKTLTTGEGGMICTDDDAWAERCRMMALHGISKDAWRRYAAEGSWQYEILAPGYKYNMTDIAAAMGVAQLRKVETMWRRRCYIAQRYNEAFSEVPVLACPYDRDDCQHAWHLYMVRLNLDLLALDRAQFIQELKGRNIGTSVHFIPLHLHPYYRETYGYQPNDFPVSFQEYQREISLPIYSKMSDEDVHDVIEAVLDVATCYSRRSVSAARSPSA